MSHRITTLGASMLWIAALLSVTACSPCSHCSRQLPLYTSHPSRYSIEIRGQVDAEWVNCLERELEVLPPAVIKTVKSISFDSEIEHFNGDRPQLAHCHDGDICINVKMMNDPTLVRLPIHHEVGHAYHHALDKLEGDFTKEWEGVAGDVYDKETSWWSTDFPSHGVLTAYGNTSAIEDVAEWVELVYEAIRSASHSAHPAQLAKFLSSEVVPDARYRQKLSLLLKYGFISKADYNKFLSLGYF